jgi:hypothetical protein
MKHLLVNTNFDRTERERQEYWQFLSLLSLSRNPEDAFACVAAFNSQSKVDFHSATSEFPWVTVQRLYKESSLLETVKNSGVAGHKSIAANWLGASHLNMREASYEKLVGTYNTTPLMARMFLLHTRNIPFAVLDTHVLRWYRKYHDDLPLIPPLSEKRYDEYEVKVLALIRDKFPGLNYAEADTMIHLLMSNRV